MSFELFEKHETKDTFIEKIRAVGNRLSAFPLAELEGLPKGDRQVFRLQQRAIGEAVTVRDGTGPRCMRYSEFVMKPDVEFASLLEPMKLFIEGLQPSHARLWKRLELMAKALDELHTECRKLLAL